MGDEVWAPYEPRWLGVGEGEGVGVELDTSEVRASPPGGGDRKG